ncbi:MAG: hypothetical protein GY729_01200, partial [Desulfobacteraceae bacterium]|nr:hypothetical protein [Desulfobacteraceae bacterium]
MKIKLEKGKTAIELDIDDNKILDIIIGKEVPALSHETVKEIISQGVAAHLPGEIQKKKK